jgi:hypothetical protein
MAERLVLGGGDYRMSAGVAENLAIMIGVERSWKA